MPENLFAQPFFLVGLAGVMWMFFGGTLTGFALFLPGGPYRGLMRAQTVLLAVGLVLLYWASARIGVELQAVVDGAEVGRAEVLERRKESLSLILLGVASVFNALLTGFGWIRLGDAGNALRTVPWALPGVRVVMAAVGLQALLDTVSGAGGEPLPAAELPATFSGLLDPARGTLTTMSYVLVGVVVGSFVVQVVARRGRQG
jgi:hypothetical protein